MKSTYFTPILLTLSLTVAASATAQSLEVKKMRGEQEKLLADRTALTNQRCGTGLSTSFDWRTFDEAEVLKKRATAWCQAALEAVEDICRTPAGKDALQALKSISCANSAAPSAVLSKGVLTFSFALTPNQNKLLVRTYLEKNL